MSKLPIDKEYLRNQFSAYNTNVINPQLQILIDGIKGKISLQQSASNKGKLFIVGEDGIVGVQAPLTSYNGESPAPISGLAVKDAISTLATEKVGGEGKYIQSIVENQGIITAIEANADFATSVQGNRADSAVQTIKVKSRVDEPAKTYQGNDIVLPDYPTSLPASDVYAWAKASTRPEYSFNDLTSHPNNLAGYGILDAATSSQGSKADSAVQQVTVNGNTYQGNKIILPDYPDSLAPGDIADWAKQPNPPQYPTLAAAGIQDAATATQGAKADSAVQTITFDNNTYSGPDITLTRPSYSFSEITDKPTTLQGYGIIDAATATQGSKADSAIQGAIQDGAEITINSKQQLMLPSFPTSLPASDVYSWAKASNKPTYNFAEILNKPLGEPTIISADGTIVSIGIATLDTEGKVPSSQLPSYVDDVLEYATKSDFPQVGQSGIIYLAKNENKTYRWTGTTYGVIGSDLALGETSATAYAGDKGKLVANNLAALTTNFNSHNANTTVHITANERTTWNGKYAKPSAGIPKTDLSSAVQSSLSLADTALQKHQDISGKLDASIFNTHANNNTIHITANERTSWNNKQNALTTQTAYSAKGSAVKVPQITTNTLGQVTKIEEVTITQPDISGKADKASITAGTYTSVTVNAQGIVTGGSNPTPSAVNGTVTATALTIPTSAPATIKAGSVWISA